MTITAATLIGLAWKSAAIAGLSLLLLHLLKRRSAAERSLIAHVGLAALLVLPLASLLLPQWAPLPASWFAEPAAAPAIIPQEGGTSAAVALPAVTASVPAVAAASSPLPASWPSAAELAVWVYALPLALLFLTMLVAVVRLFAMRGRADVLVQPSWLSALAEAQRRMGFKHGTALLVSEELRSPISWGVLRPTIVLSPHAVAAVGEAEAIIAHELAHVARLDWAKLLAARLACALFWFNPLVWMLARESHQLREEAADDAVLLADIDGPDYATLLVGAARHDNKAVLLAAHGVAPGRNSLKRRITRVLDARVRRGPAGPGWVAVGFAFLAGVTLPLAAFSATAAPREAEATSMAAQYKVAAPRAVAVRAEEDMAPARKPIAPEDLIGMKAMGVTPEDVREARAEDGSIDPDDLIAGKAVGASPAYLKRMRAVFPDANGDDLIGAAALGIDVGYAREMKALFPRVTIDDLSGMRALGVDAAYVRRMRGAGMPLASPDDAIEHRALDGGIDVPRIVSGALSTAARATSMAVRSTDSATAVVEMRGVDGSTTRVAAPQPPVPPAPPEK